MKLIVQVGKSVFQEFLPLSVPKVASQPVINYWPITANVSSDDIVICPVHSAAVIDSHKICNFRLNLCCQPQLKQWSLFLLKINKARLFQFKLHCIRSLQRQHVWKAQPKSRFRNVKMKKEWPQEIALFPGLDLSKCPTGPTFLLPFFFVFPLVRNSSIVTWILGMLKVLVEFSTLISNPWCNWQNGKSEN